MVRPSSGASSEWQLWSVPHASPPNHRGRLRSGHPTLTRHPAPLSLSAPSLARAWVERNRGKQAQQLLTVDWDLVGIQEVKHEFVFSS